MSQTSQSQRQDYQSPRGCQAGDSTIRSSERGGWDWDSGVATDLTGVTVLALWPQSLSPRTSRLPEVVYSRHYTSCHTSMGLWHSNTGNDCSNCSCQCACHRRCDPRASQRPPKSESACCQEVLTACVLDSGPRPAG